MNLQKIHEGSFGNYHQIKTSRFCGCFYCQRIFPTKLVTDCIQDPEPTALCPFCGIDALLGASDGPTIDLPLLEDLHKYAFGQ